jgi:hypothetical protein
MLLLGYRVHERVIEKRDEPVNRCLGERLLEKLIRRSSVRMTQEK